MDRLVVHDEKKPFVLKLGGEMTKICMCGLSREMPYCDDSHKKTFDEEEGILYTYDKDLVRKKHE